MTLRGVTATWSPDDEARHRAFERYFARGQTIIAQDGIFGMRPVLRVREDRVAVDRTFENEGR